MSEISAYQDEKLVCAGLARQKAKTHGRSTWSFEHEGKTIGVTAKKDKHGHIRVTTAESVTFQSPQTK